MRATVLLNDSAAALARIGARDAAGHVRELFKEAGVDADVRIVKGKHITGAARAALASGADSVVAGGGDGTVAAVAEALVGSNKPIGVLPLGTMNHFAKDIGIPIPLEDAIRAIATGGVRAVDVGEVNGAIFVNNASIGMYPRVVGKREELRRRLGHNKWVAMAMAIVSVLRRSPTVDVRIVTDGEAIRRETPFVFVGNNRYEVKLFAIGARPSLDRGELSVYFTTRTGRFAIVRLALRALLGRLEQAKDFESTTLQEFWIDTRRRHLHVATDGEVHTFTPPLHFRTRPRALNVIAPRGNLPA